MIRCTCFLFILLSNLVYTQEKDSLAPDHRKAKSFELHMGFDWYYALNSMDQKAEKLPFFVSFAHNREVQQNLIYAELKWSKKRIRSHFIPAMGTFMDQNSASEKGVFRNLLEANVGLKPLMSHNLWIDAGILGSPYTNENPYSQEHLTLTRSLAAEYVPYYLAGVKASWQLNARYKIVCLLLNGWQQIHDINRGKSLGTQLEFKPNDRDIFNWNTYVGSEGTEGQSNFGMRYFTDIFWTRICSQKFSFASCAFAGVQRQQGANKFWGQANTTLRYATKKSGAVSLRAEYFYDPSHIVVAPHVPEGGFQCLSYSVGYGYHLLKSMLFRIEYRRLQSTGGDFYQNASQIRQHQLHLWTTALTFWF